MKKTLFFSLLLGCSIFSLQSTCAQEAATSSQSTTSLNHIAVYVNNLAISTDFYEKIVGLPIIPEPFKDGRHTWFSLGPHSALHLISGAAKGLPHNKNEHLCFSVPNLDEVIALLDKSHIEYINWAGTAKAPTVRVDGVKQIYFQDPDGHWIEVNNARQ